jgi:hypothetical protein
MTGVCLQVKQLKETAKQANHLFVVKTLSHFFIRLSKIVRVATPRQPKTHMLNSHQKFLLSN